MGNTVPKRASHEAGTAAGTKGKRSKGAADEAEAPAAPRRVAVAQRYDEEQEEEALTTKRAGRRRAGVPRPGGDDGAPAGRAVATVKILMRRKDAEVLVARLHAQRARERKARMAELKRQIRAGDGGGDGAIPASCGDAWRPRLAPVEENQC